MTNNFYIDDNGKKKQLNNVQHGVRREQVDEKFHNLFDAYDINQDGTLEQGELQEITKSVSLFAGSDNTLDRAENKNAASLFANKFNIKDADLMGFVKSVSDASEDIVSSETTKGADGGDVITTTYKNGLIETIYYYPDGEFKLKTQKLDSSTETAKYCYTDNGKDYKECSSEELEQMINNGYKKFRAAEQRSDSSRITFIEGYRNDFLQAHDVIALPGDKKEIHIDNTEISDRAKYEAAIRDFVLTHFVETHKMTQEALDTMGILDDIGAAINAGAGELLNACKNIYNKHFGDGTEEDYQNFYELVKKFEPNYNQSLRTESNLELMREHPVGYFTGESANIDTEQGLKFMQTTEQYQNAQILKSRLDILKNAMSEISMYESEQNAITHAPAQTEGLNPASHILKANNLLLQYFDNDQVAVDMMLNGTYSNAQSTIKAINDIKEETEKLYQNVLGDKTFEEIKADYQEQYKAIYNTDFVPDELTDKVMAAKMTGGMAKLALITIISILVTKSPIMTEIMGATAGSAEATGAAAKMISTLTKRYGTQAVLQGIKFARTSGTLTLDVGSTLLNQLTSERGYNGEEFWESAKSSAKYIYFGTYIGAPLAQAVSRQLGKIGAASRLFEGGAKSMNGAVRTTSITGEKLVQNFMKGGNKVFTTGGAFLTEVGAFTGLEIATEGIDPLTAGEEQVEMLGKLKIMNHFLEYMLGGKVYAGMSKAKMDAAIEQSGVKNWTITEIKNPNKTVYEVRVAEGLPPIRLEDANQVATVMLERVGSVYANETRNAGTKTDNAGDKADVTAAPKGLNTEGDAFIEKAKTENPAEVVEGKVRKAWQESGLTEEVPEEHVDLFNLDPYAGLKEPAPEVNGEVTHLILTGKLKESLTQHYERLDGVFKDIAQKRSSDFKKAAEECGSDKQAFAQRVVEILAEEMGMQDCKPNIKLTEMNDADGMANWQTGTIEINKNTYSAKRLVEIISHEYVHMLQYRDIIAQYGEKGLRELIMADKSIPKNEKETRINDVLNSEYTQKLLENREQLKHAETGSLNEYRMRIYKDEFANNIGTEDMPRYTNQVLEVEAYHLGSHALGENTELDGITVGESAPNDKLLRAARQKLKERLKNGETVPEKISDTAKTAEKPEYTVNEDGTVTRLGQVSRKNLPAGRTGSDAENTLSQTNGGDNITVTTNHLRENLQKTLAKNAENLNTEDKELFDMLIDDIVKDIEDGYSLQEAFSLHYKDLTEYMDIFDCIEIFTAEIPSDKRYSACVNLYNEFLLTEKGITIKELSEDAKVRTITSLRMICADSNHSMYFGGETGRKLAVMQDQREAFNNYGELKISDSKWKEHIAALIQSQPLLMEYMACKAGLKPIEYKHPQELFTALKAKYQQGELFGLTADGQDTMIDTFFARERFDDPITEYTNNIGGGFKLVHELANAFSKKAEEPDGISEDFLAFCKNSKKVNDYIKFIESQKLLLVEKIQQNCEEKGSNYNDEKIHKAINKVFNNIDHVLYRAIERKSNIVDSGTYDDSKKYNDSENVKSIVDRLAEIIASELINAKGNVNNIKITKALSLGNGCKLTKENDICYQTLEYEINNWDYISWYY